MGLPTLGLGAVMGYLAAGSKITPTAADIKYLVESKPEYYTTVDIDLSTARDNEEFTKTGNFIWVDNHFARGKVTIRLNEQNHKELDLRRQKFVSGPFYQFFITNDAGQGSITLIISRGFEFASEPVEAIKLDELAARLGSIVTHDRRGDVIWVEDFEHGVETFRKGELGGTGYLNWSALYSRTKGFSCELITPAAVGASVLMKHEGPLPVMGKIGIEFSFSHNGGLEYLYIPVQARDGVVNHNPKIKWLADTNTWQYNDSDGYYQSLTPTKILHEGFRIFHVVKLVLDLVAGEYVRLICDEHEYDMSGLSYRQAAVAADALLFFDITAATEEAESTYIYVDDVIITQNEPA